jgi:peptidylprolyl isomerase
MPPVNRRRLLPCLAAVVGIAVAGCGSDNGGAKTTKTATAPKAHAATAEPSRKLAKKPRVAKPTGPAPKTLKTKDLVVGTGRPAKAGDQLTVQYVGVLYKNGKQFDASWDRGQPFSFQLGANMVIPGWDRGLVGMKVGGRRELIIPPDLAYGAQGAPPDIGPNEPLVFVIDLLAAR